MDVIGDLLRASLLADIGDDEERARRVRDASKDLAGSFAGASRALVPNAVVAAVDERTAADTTVLQAAEDALLVHWETFRNAFPETPTELLRAVTLAAVVDAAAAEQKVLHAAWYALRTAAECVPGARWTDQVGAVLDLWSPSVRDALTESWTPAAVVPRFKMPPVAVGDGEITATTDARSKASELVASGNWQTFATQLVSEFEDYVDNFITAAEEAATDAYRRSSAQLKAFAEALGGRLREAIGAQDRAITSGRLRTDLLWWRQTAFSDRLEAPYAELGDAADVAIAAALDLHDQVPDVAPLVVEHVLADLVASLTDDDDTVKVAALAAATTAAYLPSVEPLSSPLLLLDAIAAGRESSTPITDSTATLSAPRAAVLLFRDLQARRLAQPPTTTHEAVAEAT